MTVALEAVLTGDLPPALYRCRGSIQVTTITRQAEEHGWRILVLDGATIGGKADLLSQSAAALHFPAYFGHNWDSFEECLNDMSWEPQRPLLLLFSSAGQFASAEPDQFATALDILAAAAGHRRDGPEPLAVLLQGAGRAAAHLPAVHL